MIGLCMSVEKGLPAVAHVQVVALYDLDDGRIEHLHMVTTLSGVTPLTQNEAIEAAKRHAGRHIANVEDLGVALSNEEEHGLLPHTIDVGTKVFVPLPDGQRAEATGSDEAGR